MLKNIDNNELNLTITNGNTFNTYHTYEIDWKPDQITWSIDGKILRTVQKQSTFNKTDNTYHYPQTPARVQLSLWPAGSTKNAPGTIAWAGGLVDWNSEDVKANGYYYAMFKDVKVDCYQPPSGANVTGSKAYIYTSSAGTEKSIAETNDGTVLKSLLSTGTDKEKDYPKPAPEPSTKSSSGTETSSTASSSSAAATSEVATIPGLTGAGPGTDGQRGADKDSDDNGSNSNNDNNSSNNNNSNNNNSNNGDDGTGSGSGSDSGSKSDGSSSGSGSGSGGTSSSSGASSTPTGEGGFSQGTKSSTNNAPLKSESVLQGSMLAILIAVVGTLLM